MTEQDRLEQIAAMLLNGSSLREIGDALGLSYEGVRQIALKHGLKKNPAPRPQKWPIPGFAKRMKGWLWSAGYRKCSTCQMWTDGPARYRCRACNRAREKQRYYTKDGREKCKQYRHRNPDVGRRARQRYYQKLRKREGRLK